MSVLTKKNINDFVRSWHWQLVTVLMLFSSAAHCHSVGESYLFLSTDETSIEVELQLTLDDIGKILRQAGRATGEVDAQAAEAQIDWLKRYIVDGIELRGGSERYTLDYVEHDSFDTPVGEFFRFQLEGTAAQPVPDRIDVDYSLVFDADPQHTALLLVQYSDKTDITNFTNEVALQLGNESRSGVVDLTESIHLQIFLGFIASGAGHIVEGIDHVLFLVALVLLSVVMFDNGRWRPVTSFRPAFINIVKIVTLFTVAHTITLSLATLGYVQLPSRLVESIIAASVAFVAINALYPMVKDRIWVLVFGFGLFHGLGFAGNLEYLGLAKGSLLYPLAGFNVGVELGQLALIVVAFPVVYALSRKSFYVGGVLKPGSAAVALVALLWLTERVFDINGLAPG